MRLQIGFSRPGDGERQALAFSSPRLQPSNQFRRCRDGSRVSTLSGRTVALLASRRAALPDVISAGQDHKKLTIQPVHQAMFLIDAARPAAGQVVPQGLGFADASEGIAQASLDQQVDAPQLSSVLALPVHHD